MGLKEFKFYWLTENLNFLFNSPEQRFASWMRGKNSASYYSNSAFSLARFYIFSYSCLKTICFSYYFLSRSYSSLLSSASLAAFEPSSSSSFCFALIYSSAFFFSSSSSCSFCNSFFFISSNSRAWAYYYCYLLALSLIYIFSLWANSISIS